MSVHTTPSAYSTPEILFKGSLHNLNNHPTISCSLTPLPLPCLTSTKITHIAVHATQIKYKVPFIVLPLIGVKRELEEQEDREDIAPSSKKRRICKIYNKEICRQQAGEINLSEIVICIELQPLNPLLSHPQYKYWLYFFSF